MNFEITINKSLANIFPKPPFSPVQNKYLLSVANDYEDGKWRYKNFENFVWDNIAETSLSYRERQSLIESHHTLLSQAARSLRLTDKDDDIGKGSELAEIVLYGIMKHHYKALPVVPKIFYKQNPQDNAKGADSVHILLSDDNDFSLWFGEAKFYKTIEDARLGAIVTSVETALGSEKLRKENSIITNVSDLQHLVTDNELRGRILDALSHKKSIDILKPRINVPILLLHECSLTKAATELTPKYQQDLIAYHKERAAAYFKKQVEAMATMTKYGDVKFHLILFPVPSKKKIVDRFVANVEHYKADDE